MLKKSQLAFYKENGYIVVKQMISPDSFIGLFSTTVNLLKNYADGLINPSAEFNSWEDENFHRVMIALREKSPERFSAVYKAVQKSCSIANLTRNQNILDHIAILLNDSTENLSHTVSVLRMDPPYDKNNAFGFHQDSAYFDYQEYVCNQNIENNITCWLPMTKTDSTLGSAKLCAKSHTAGFHHNYKQLPVTHPISSDITKQYDVVDLKMDAGDAAFFYGSLIHSSGQNISSKIRFTFVTRYYKMMAEDFYLHPDVGEKISGELYTHL
jgi:ectoine hydroxylase-related dioxygenase (phytanoyl-CoA dioxygenase family)